MPQKQGHLTLNPIPNSQTENPEYPTINVHLNVILDSLKWSLNDGRYLEYEVPDLIPHIACWSVAHLVLSHNKHEPILRELVSVPIFSNLRSLTLKNNELESLECLGRANMPKLDNLWLSDNHISCLKSLRKNSVSFPNLDWLSLENNPVVDLSPLVEMVMKTKQLFEETPVTMLEIGQPEGQNFIIQNATWTARISPNIEIMVGLRSLIPKSAGSSKEAKSQEPSSSNPNKEEP